MKHFIFRMTRKSCVVSSRAAPDLNIPGRAFSAGSSALLFLLITFISPSWATTYHLPSDQDSLVGQSVHIKSVEGDNATKIGVRYDVGFNALEDANPQWNFKYNFRPDIELNIPTAHVLPPLDRQGIVVNVAEMRLYYYPGDSTVMTYPIGIGKIGNSIPLEPTTVQKKLENPKWIPTPNIIAFNLKQGVILPAVMPPGPDNPLGTYAIYLRLPTYRIHATIFPESVGRRASFGCIRMYESDIKEIFPMVENNISVMIVNMPVKAGWRGNRLYLEAHPPLEEHVDNSENTLPGVVTIIQNAVGNQDVLIDWQQVAFINKTRDGLPHEIGMRL